MRHSHVERSVIPILDGKYKGKSIHRFSIDEHSYFVILGVKFMAAQQGTVVYVIAPSGISYKQAAIEADRARKEGKFTSSGYILSRKES